MTTGKRLYSKVHRQAATLAALGHPHRLAIAYLLALQPHRLAHLARRVGIPAPLALHHLKILQKAGLIGKEYEGVRAVYSFRRSPLWLVGKLLEETKLS